jgi:entericidin B
MADENGNETVNGAFSGTIMNRTDAMTRTLALFALLGLVACETVEGAGRDIETAGEVITDEAQDAQAGN